MYGIQAACESKTHTPRQLELQLNVDTTPGERTELAPLEVQYSQLHET